MSALAEALLAATGYDSPTWFYVFMVPVFAVLAAALGVLAWAIWKETK